MSPLEIGAYTATSAAGVGLIDMRNSIAARRSGLGQNDFPGCDLQTWIGRVYGIEAVELPSEASHLVSRNNQLAWMGLQQDGMLESIAQLRRRIGPERVGIVLGTSTSSIGRTEEAYAKLLPDGRMPTEFRQPLIHQLHSTGTFVAIVTGLTGPSMTISTACSSSAKVFAAAARWIEHGIVDAAVVGGVDSLCLSTLYGFNSLELLSESPCRPFDRRRDGINIGEACGYAIVAKPGVLPDARMRLLGYGESSDAHHMTHPHPEGLGAIMAIDRALDRARLDTDAIDYVNLHGTATLVNDRVEGRVLAQRFTGRTRASSTKGWTGHTLGAAGILEAVVTLEAMRAGQVFGTLNLEEPDPEAEFAVQIETVPMNIRRALSNSFGFGGNNATLVFGQIYD